MESGKEHNLKVGECVDCREEYTRKPTHLVWV